VVLNTFDSSNGIGMKTIESTVETIFDLYKTFGEADYIGEPVSQIEHMSQSAQLAIAEGYDDEVVLAAFFHDLGHICVMNREANSMDGFGIKRHEEVGADFLREQGFPERIAQLVKNHVQAKRYLTFIDTDYYNQLSEASKQTLKHQGGVMTRKEAELFEKDDLFEVSIRMRRWDELAKEMNVPVIDLEEMKKRAKRVLEQSLTVI
jgi:phosphonate degradation associated HDIG domain protein